MTIIRTYLPKLIVLLLVLVLTPHAAMAHPGHDVAGSWMEGFYHPLQGWDHAIAMVAVGVWAAQQRGAARWALPLSFVTMMAVGGLAGMGGAAIPFAEELIGISVIAFSLFVVLRSQVSAPLGVCVAALFAVFHGFTHGAEMSAGTVSPAYGIGFVMATVLLHGAGFITSMVIGRMLTTRVPSRGYR